MIGACTVSTTPYMRQIHTYTSLINDLREKLFRQHFTNKDSCISLQTVYVGYQQPLCMPTSRDWFFQVKLTVNYQVVSN